MDAVRQCLCRRPDRLRGTGVFQPFARNHKESYASANEPWAYGDEAEAIARLPEVRMVEASEKEIIAGNLHPQEFLETVMREIGSGHILSYDLQFFPLLKGKKKAPRATPGALDHEPKQL